MVKAVKSRRPYYERVPYFPTAREILLLKVVDDIAPSAPVVEDWLLDLLTEHGIECLVGEPHEDEGEMYIRLNSKCSYKLRITECELPREDDGYVERPKQASA